MKHREAAPYILLAWFLSLDVDYMIRTVKGMFCQKTRLDRTNNATFWG